MPDELRLNSLSRFSKQSDEYTLEVHSHCEVPAGCGGVVLRWRNPRLSIPIEIWTYTTGEAQLFLDGNVPASARPLVPYGEHVLSWIITGFDPDGIVLACSATYDDTWRPVHVHVSPPTGQIISILSAPDGTWRYTFTPPPGTWTRPDFDDTAWGSMVARPVNEEQRMEQYRLNHVCTLGAQPLGAEGSSHAVWIRRQFSLVDEQHTQQEATDEE
jgi:hypothetical protein